MIPLVSAGIALVAGERPEAAAHHHDMCPGRTAQQRWHGLRYPEGANGVGFEHGAHLLGGGGDAGIVGDIDHQELSVYLLGAEPVGRDLTVRRITAAEPDAMAACS